MTDQKISTMASEVKLKLNTDNINDLKDLIQPDHRKKMEDKLTEAFDVLSGKFCC